MQMSIVSQSTTRPRVAKIFFDGGEALQPGGTVIDGGARRVVCLRGRAEE
jgi:hypothetical protein